MYTSRVHPAQPAPTEKTGAAKGPPRAVEKRTLRVVEEPRMTVAVIAYRSPDAVVDCLEAVSRACEDAAVPIERLLADCGGNERFGDRLEAYVDTVLKLETDLSLNAARNDVLEGSAAPLVMLVDDDGLLARDAVRRMLRWFDDAKVVAARGRIVSKDRRYYTTLADHYDRGPNVIDDTLATEGHMATRRSVALEVGGFDERLFGHEGLELTYRLLRSAPGARVIYVPDVVMRHDFMRGLRHFVKKCTAYGGLRDAVVALHADDPGFVEFAAADARRRRPRGRLRPDEWVARLALRVLRGAVSAVGALRERGRPETWGHASPRRDG